VRCPSRWCHRHRRSAQERGAGNRDHAKRGSRAPRSRGCGGRGRRLAGSGGQSKGRGQSSPARGTHQAARKPTAAIAAAFLWRATMDASCGCAEPPCPPSIPPLWPRLGLCGPPALLELLAQVEGNWDRAAAGLVLLLAPAGRILTASNRQAAGGRLSAAESPGIGRSWRRIGAGAAGSGSAPSPGFPCRTCCVKRRTLAASSPGSTKALQTGRVPRSEPLLLIVRRQLAHRDTLAEVLRGLHGAIAALPAHRPPTTPSQAGPPARPLKGSFLAKRAESGSSDRLRLRRASVRDSVSS